MQEEITIREAEKFSGLSHSYLIRLAKEGKINGRQISAQFWVVERASVEAYLSRDRKPGPKGPIKHRQQEEPAKQLMPAVA